MLDDLRAIEDPSAYPEQGPPPWSMADEKILASLPPHNRALIYQRRAAQAAAPPRTRWSTFDEGTLARFPSLEAFTCVICDGGFVDQYGPFVGQGVQMVPQAPSCSRQQEFDGFVELLKGVLPRLHERGLLRFRMSDI
ncbi:hypothetical protein C8T65DRAFT_649864 [Cerioporus squamosus]|nr:hypothetical protein C8T65DRAFT_649864 [Cerioporus squamosus]